MQCEEVKKSESDVEEINLAMEMEEDESMKKLMRDEKKALLESQQQLYSDIINYCVPALETGESLIIMYQLWKNLSFIVADGETTLTSTFCCPISW